MNNKIKVLKPFATWMQIICLTIVMFLIVGFTIYIQQPDPIEINQIAFAGRETINNNNKYAFDLFKWAPGYTDQALIQINNNTGENLSWNISLENLEAVDNSLLESIGVYIKERPTSRDVLPRYDSVITEGYKYFGTLSELQNSNFLNGILTDYQEINLSILLHVAEDANIKETEFNFRNILKVSTISNIMSTNKTFE